VDAGARRRRPGDSGLDLAALSRSLGRILVVNAGSTSLKLSVVDALEQSEPLPSLDALPDDVGAVGHRVVHGGRVFGESALIDPETIEQIGQLASLAPLHTEPALRGIRTAQAALPDVPHVAVFDSAFHRGIPDEASTYAIPLRWREKWGIRRYGFHGLAVASVADRIRSRRLVVCHLGGGCSVTAVLDGRSVDTTMGFSPLEGIPMATRSGSIDPGALFYLLREQALTPAELDHTLEHESGLAALGGLDDPLGFAVYTYRVAQAVAAMATALGGIDTLAFSGGVGENRSDVREAVVERTRFLGEFTVEVVVAREDVIVGRHVRALLAQ
jgi:acetate kinase